MGENLPAFLQEQLRELLKNLNSNELHCYENWTCDIEDSLTAHLEARMGEQNAAKIALANEIQKLFLMRRDLVENILPNSRKWVALEFGAAIFKGLLK